MQKQEEDVAQTELLQRPKDYLVKFRFPEPPPLQPPVLGLHSKQNFHIFHMLHVITLIQFLYNKYKLNLNCNILRFFRCYFWISGPETIIRGHGLWYRHEQQSSHCRTERSRKVNILKASHRRPQSSERRK